MQLSLRTVIVGENIVLQICIVRQLNYSSNFSIFFVFCLQQVTQIDNDLKAKANAYNNLKGNLQSLERRAT